MAKKKVEVRYTFVNPNTETKKFEDILRQIIFEKLLSMINQPCHAARSQ
ncbi:MAG: hypothetical protein HDT14_08325 [Oscillibacter sp.]|nr:hypothetical protein [Oscillibacter sp.]